MSKGNWHKNQIVPIWSAYHWATPGRAAVGGFTDLPSANRPIEGEGGSSAYPRHFRDIPTAFFWPSLSDWFARRLGIARLPGPSSQKSESTLAGDTPEKLPFSATLF